MKNKNLIVIVSFLSVLICLVITTLLFYVVPPKFLVVLAFIVGIITGVCVTMLIYNLINIFKAKTSK
ncbi:MAG: hypothetical protein ABR927_01055 [Bacteroidales bacterium]